MLAKQQQEEQERLRELQDEYRRLVDRQQAVDVRGYADFVPMGASVVPLRGSEDIMWTVKFRSGQVKRFKFPIRKTPEGSAVPDGGYGEVTTDLASQCLYNEPAALKLDALPTIK